MFIIPCKYDPLRPIIFECVRRIKKHHPNELIVIVDSDSEDTSYFTELQGKDIYVYDARNQNYGVNAFRLAYEMFPDEDEYYCIYDSLFLNQSLHQFTDNSFTAIRHFNTPPTGWGWDGDGVSLYEWAKIQIAEKLGREIPNEFTGILGPMWICNNQVMRDLSTSGVFNILPEDKYQLCAMERIMGIVLQWLGYDPQNSIQGEMFGFFDPYDETYVTKVNMARW